MAKVSNFLYAANVIQESNGQLHVINPLQIISPVCISSTYSFFVVLSLRDFDTTKSHVLKTAFTNLENPEKPIVESSSTIPPIPKNPKADLPNEYEGLLTSLGFQNVILEKEGLYKTNLYFDGDNIGEYEIYVARIKR